MNTLQVTIKDKVAFIQLDRGRSNAINAEMVSELGQMIRSIEVDDQIAGVILTGKQGFFSAGLDLIELYDYDQDQIRTFWKDFLSLVSSLVAFRKPMVSAISGHSPAGGCVLALCADYRVMSEGKYIIGLNEVPVGLIVPESIFQLYAFWIGKASAYRNLLEGKLMSPEEAVEAGLIDELVPDGSILHAAERAIKRYTQHSAPTWQQSKLNMRNEIIASSAADHEATLEVMLRQWWSPSTRSILKTIITNLQQKA